MPRRRSRLPATIVLLGLAALLAAGRPVQAADCRYDQAASLPLRGAEGADILAEANGQPVVLTLSTGLGLTSLVPATVQRLGLARDPNRRTGFADGSVEPNALLRRLRIGGLDWSDRSLAVRADFTPDGYPVQSDGALAANLLRETELELDLGHRRVALHPARGCRPGPPPWTPAGSAVLQLEEHGVPAISGQVRGQVVRLLLNSGTNRSSMPRSLAERLGLNQPTGAQLRSHGMMAGPSRGREYLLPDLAVGGEVLRDFRIVVAEDGARPAPAQIVLGRDWMARRPLWFSWANRRLYLAPGG
jgi:predicted aspartyl protease